MKFVVVVQRGDPKKGVIRVNLYVLDPKTEAQTEHLGELLMWDNQWLMLKYMLIHGETFWLDNEAQIVIEEK